MSQSFKDKGIIEQLLWVLGILAGLYFFYLFCAMMYMRFQKDPFEQLDDRVRTQRSDQAVLEKFEKIRSNLENEREAADRIKTINEMTPEIARNILDRLKLQRNLHTDLEVLSASVGSGDVMGVAAAVRLKVFVPGDLLIVAAAGGKSPEITEILIKGGAPVNETFNGQTALILAAQNSDSTTMRHLLAAGANPNMRDNYGDTALSYAAYRGCADCVQQLIQAGAVVNVTNNQGRTPMMSAKEQNRHPVILLLRKAGASE